MFTYLHKLLCFIFYFLPPLRQYVLEQHLQFNIRDNRMHKFIFKSTSEAIETFLSVFKKCFIVAEPRHDVYWMMILKLRKTKMLCMSRKMFECIRFPILPVLGITESRIHLNQKFY